jgi:hypothetical protein
MRKIPSSKPETAKVLLQSALIEKFNAPHGVANAVLSGIFVVRGAERHIELFV